MTAVAAIEDAIRRSWNERFVRGTPAESLAERHLNEVLQDFILTEPVLSRLQPFPVRIRVRIVRGGDIMWGFVAQGDPKGLSLFQLNHPEDFESNFPANKWISRYSPTRASEQELVSIIAQILSYSSLREEYGQDTLGVLMALGAHRQVENPDEKIATLANRIDKVPLR